MDETDEYLMYVCMRIAQKHLFEFNDSYKQCKECEQYLPKTKFSKSGLDKNKIAKLRPSCKECEKIIRKKWHSTSKEYQKIQHEKLKDWKKDYYQKNKAEIKKWHANNYVENKLTINAQHKQYREENPDKEKERHAKYFQNNKEKIYAYRKKYYQEHPDKRIRLRCQQRISQIFGSADKECPDYLGCDKEFLTEWFLFQLGFSHDMTFSNYGSYWHIDHVIPCANWDLSDEENKKKCFHWTNLSPLPATVNMSKQAKINKIQIQEQNDEIIQFGKLKQTEYPLLTEI